MPPREALIKLRTRSPKPEGLREAATDKRVLRRFGGLDEEAMLLEAARVRTRSSRRALAQVQSFVTGRALSDAQATARASLPARADFKLILPLVRWINQGWGTAAQRR